MEIIIQKGVNEWGFSGNLAHIKVCFYTPIKSPQAYPIACPQARTRLRNKTKIT